MKTSGALALSVTVLALAGAAWGQSVISAKSGLVHYIEGKVLVNEAPVHIKPGTYVEVKEAQVLRTAEGRAEVLLTPGVFLRVGENSAFRMISTRLIDTRLELLAGAAIVEADEIGKDQGVTIVCKDGAASLRKKGLYRFDAEPARLRVYDGEARVTEAGKTVTVTSGNMISLDGRPATARFNKNEGDELARWSRRRGELVAMANVSTAKSFLDSGYALYSSAWGWNPYYGIWTFLPYRGYARSPYGFRFWSPGGVYAVYYRPRPVYNSGSSGWDSASSAGYSGMSQTSSGYSGAVASSGSSAPMHADSSSSSAAASSSVGRSSDTSGGGGHRK